MDQDERRVAVYLSAKGLCPERFPEGEQESEKTPDFRVLRCGAIAFFCEVKTIVRDTWLQRQPAIPVMPGVSIKVEDRNDPTYNRLAADIHEAVKQFDLVNPDVSHPNVLAFVNHDRNCSLDYLFSVYTGCIRLNDGNIEPFDRRFSDGRIKEEKKRIHLFLWFEDDCPAPWLRFTRTHSDHHDTLCVCLGCTFGFRER